MVNKLTEEALDLINDRLVKIEKFLFGKEDDTAETIRDILSEIRREL